MLPPGSFILSNITFCDFCLVSFSYIILPLWTFFLLENLFSQLLLLLSSFVLPSITSLVFFTFLQHYVSPWLLYFTRLLLFQAIALLEIFLIGNVTFWSFFSGKSYRWGLLSYVMLLFGPFVLSNIISQCFCSNECFLLGLFYLVILPIKYFIPDNIICHVSSLN